MLFFLLGVAHAYESNPQEIIVSDQIELFDSTEVDSGWIPSSGPLSIRMQIIADGGALVYMEGEGLLEWPTDLNFVVKPTDEIGYIALDTSISAVVSIKVDIANIQWETPISEEGIDFFIETFFDPFLLGSQIELTDSGTEQKLLDYDYEILPGVLVGFFGELIPECQFSFTGVMWDVDGQQLYFEDEYASWVPEGTSALDVDVTYLADVEAALLLDLVPSLEVCVPILGCYDWSLFEFPITTTEEAFSHAFPPNELHFPLPVSDIEDEEIDFGEVYVGDLVNHQVLVTNLGELPLEGDIRLLGDSVVFPVFPDSIYANAEDSDGIMLTFAPEEVGDFSGKLQFISNDPYTPMIEVAVSGTAIEEPEESTSVTESDDDIEQVDSQKSDVTSHLKGIKK